MPLVVFCVGGSKALGLRGDAAEGDAATFADRVSGIDKCAAEVKSKCIGGTVNSRRPRVAE